ncbi:hypothetical protein FNH22_15240 [Fulvivirga sp. M361]|uniref:SiaB family protein kinase n=1 Tax=Fulvivirga sp. M361 TaxID=2594266 RepID=UPI00117B8890|nr:SiaB family protein kinase [Fulvivirga sp. M361]TRX57760.1 hypothetical protein FNH22_15240 [Fulvivirga sp. M361]
MKYIFDLHKTMLDNHLILVYEGEFTQEITKSVLAMAERNMDSSGEESSIKRKVFNVMVECLQNIVKHANDVQNNHSAIFMVGKQEDEYLVVSGNSIEKAGIDDLKEKLDQINSLDRDGLKTLYKDIIKNTEISDKGGAGLGFVDMARKSGNALEYEFSPIDDKTSFFCLKSSISRV